MKRLVLTDKELEILKEAYKKGGIIIKVPRAPCKIAVVLYRKPGKDFKILQSLSNELSSKLQEFYRDSGPEQYFMIGLKSFVENYR